MKTIRALLLIVLPALLFAQSKQAAQQKPLVFAHVTVIDVSGAKVVVPDQTLIILDSLGTVEKGKTADLVMLEANPLDDISNTRRISAVVVRGKMIGRSDLQNMQRKLEAAAESK